MIFRIPILKNLGTDDMLDIQDWCHESFETNPQTNYKIWWWWRSETHPDFKLGRSTCLFMCLHGKDNAALFKLRWAGELC